MLLTETRPREGSGSNKSPHRDQDHRRHPELRRRIAALAPLLASSDREVRCFAAARASALVADAGADWHFLLGVPPPAAAIDRPAALADAARALLDRPPRRPLAASELAALTRVACVHVLPTPTEARLIRSLMDEELQNS